MAGSLRSVTINHGPVISTLSASPRNSDFIHYLDALYLPISNRLRDYASPEDCGSNNERLRTDLQNDQVFQIAARQLHESAVSSCFSGTAPSGDGFGIQSIWIECGVRLQVNFQLSFFAGSGHSYSPAMYRLTRTTESAVAFAAEYGCGLRDECGGFWYPRTDKYCGKNDPMPESGHDWAMHVTKRYGKTSLAKFVRKRDHRR